MQLQQLGKYNNNKHLLQPQKQRRKQSNNQLQGNVLNALLMLIFSLRNVTCLFLSDKTRQQLRSHITNLIALQSKKTVWLPNFLQTDQSHVRIKSLGKQNDYGDVSLHIVELILLYSLDWVFIFMKG